MNVKLVLISSVVVFPDLERLHVGVDGGGAGGRGQQGSTEPVSRGVRPGTSSTLTDGDVVLATGVSSHRDRPCRRHQEIRGGAGRVADTAVALLGPGQSTPLPFVIGEGRGYVDLIQFVYFWFARC